MRHNLWFMRKEASTGLPCTTIVGQRNYALPSNFKDLIKGGLVYLDSVGNTIPMDVIGDVRATMDYDLNDKGEPEAVVIKSTDGSDTYDVYPLPDGVYTIAWRYWAFLPELNDTTNTSNYFSVNFPNILIYAGTAKAFEYLQEWELADRWRARFDDELNKLVSYHSERLTSGFDLSPRDDVNTNYKIVQGYNYYP